MAECQKTECQMTECQKAECQMVECQKAECQLAECQNTGESANVEISIAEIQWPDP